MTSLHCETCDRDFDDQRQFAVHMVRNHMELWVFDDFGNRKKPQDENKGVLDAIKNEDRFSCELCAKTFSTKSRLVIHKETLHGAYDRYRLTHRRAVVPIGTSDVFFVRFSRNL